ncbi:hypothetical protein [Chitinophaga ginsengisegetis]|uniref:hypothetical protein n=1 Tax=Chitinophaga ginsengisegetis TaxID=393003 RepID=UPI000DB97EB0|nr:hypothetical protein [Chitinophaga ginsengisegetis]MDR6567395.1 hypothetical protein [Chitinophaga ginsengisegetis]MDR6647126.1 hypothetical protein [Chitinophaga ginsengisegetis]MDR6653475.1 hypothetical protein [Chitinophaga ginsengisegetis]
MSQKYSRVLIEEKQVEFFLRHVLDFDPSSLEGIIPGIVAGEIGILNVPYEMQTYSGNEYRDKRFFDEPSREKLRVTIVDELLSKTRLADDEDICLGKGGALPVGGIISNRKAFILIGLPASGKSSIACRMADNFGAIILDADIPKGQLPYCIDLLNDNPAKLFEFRENILI